MLYKTIALGLLEENQKLHQELRTRGTLLQTMERYASELKTRHDYWKDELHQSQPGSDLLQISSKALELALQDLRDALPATSSPSAAPEEAPSLDEAMRFIRRHTRPTSRLARPCRRILVSFTSPTVSFFVHRHRRPPRSGQRRCRCQSAARTTRLRRPGCG